MGELTKTIAKHGTQALKGNTGIEKALRDDRVSHLIRPPFKLDVDAAVTELHTDTHLKYSYLTDLLKQIHTKAQTRELISYIKSAAANNLTPDQRAHLLMRAVEKLKYIDLIGQFFGG